MSKELVIDGKAYEDIKVGSDPELRFEGMKARPTIAFNGKFGTDGPNSQIGELRPDPFYDPINHVAEIERVLRDGFRRYPKIQGRKWLAGTMPEGHSIGGHLHFGSTYKDHLELKIMGLDKLLAPVGLLLENHEAARQRRRNTEYGRLGFHDGKCNDRNRGFKTEKTTGVGTHPLSHPGYEYRPLASWIVSRQVSNGIVALGKVIAFQTHNKEFHNHLLSQLKFIDLNKKFSDAYIDCDRKFFLPLIPTIHRVVSSFKLFPKYEKYINYLFHLIHQNRTWDDAVDIKSRWNIVPIINSSVRKGSKEKMNLLEVWNNALDTRFFIEDTTNNALFVGE